MGKDDSHTKFVIYRTLMNTNLSAVHPIYMRGCLVPDYKCVSFTRLRLTSHNLMSEKGRWSRTPSNERVCSCDKVSVQNESHILLMCPLTQNIRGLYMRKLNLHRESTVNDNFIHRCLETFKWIELVLSNECVACHWFGHWVLPTFPLFPLYFSFFICNVLM